MKRWLVALAFVPSCALGAVPDESLDAKQLVETYNQSKKQLIDAEMQKRRILGSLYGINKRMKKITKEKSELTDELFVVQYNVKNIAKLIAELEQKIEEQRKRLKQRLRALYKMSGEGYMAIFFSGANSLSIDESLRYLKIVTDNDYRLIRSYQQNVAEYKAQKKKFNRQVERLITIEKRIKKQEGMLAEEHHAKTKMVTELESARVKELSKIKSIRSQSQQLEAKNGNLDETYSDMLRPSFFERKGQLQPPVTGSLIEDFGIIRDDRFKVQLSHKGWRYSVLRGSPVYSVYEGKVVYANWINGYGNTIIVDHGDHYYTVYAHLGKLQVANGEAVKTQQLIAESGAASRRYSDGIYFEIRHFSEPENPLHWLIDKTLPTAVSTRKGDIQ